VSHTPLNAELSALYGGWIKRMALLLKLRMPWADLDELLQSGAVGMLEALRRYNPDLGVPFQAFAARRIKGAMIDGLRRDGARRRGELPLVVEQADAAQYEAGEHFDDPLSHLVRAGDRAALIIALKKLNPIEYRVLALHFYDDMNNREIALTLDMSEGYASRIRKRALTSLALLMTSALNGETV
jgi:RNA polymerase sigma factor (sigma-70 family)